MSVRYELTEDFAVFGRFRTGRAVTCALFDGLTGAVIPVTGNVSVEIGASGIYRFNNSNITVAIAAYTIVVWQMTDTVSGRTDGGFVVVGGGGAIPPGLLTIPVWLALRGGPNKC